MVWVGEEDHLRIISMQEGGNVGEVYARLVQGIEVNTEKKIFYFLYSIKKRDLKVIVDFKKTY